jgi:cytochrome P450
MSAFVAVHTKSIVLYAAIYRLAHNPSIFEELRAEALNAFEIGKPSNLPPSLKLFRTEKFIYECLRHGHQNLLVIRRVVATKDGYLFSNGYRAPKGTVVAFPGYEMHRDINLQKQRDELYSTHQQTEHVEGGRDGEDVDYTIDSKLLGDHFLIFGNGRHVW